MQAAKFYLWSNGWQDQNEQNDSEGQRQRACQRNVMKFKPIK
jgi:hypothetical protein